MDSKSHGLSGDRWVRFIFFITIAAAGSSFLSILLSSYNELSLCFKSECFDFFFDVYSFPTRCLAAGISALGLRVLFIKSYQTSYQIHLLKAQNDFKYFLDHRREFLTLLDNFETGSSVRIVRRQGLYRVIFPTNSVHNVALSVADCPEGKEALMTFVNDFNKLLDGLNRLQKAYIEKRAGVKDSFVSQRRYALWLTELVSFAARLGVYPKGIDDFSTYGKPIIGFLHDLGAGIPCDLKSFIVDIEGFLEELLYFCFPGFDLNAEFSLDEGFYDYIISEIKRPYISNNPHKRRVTLS